jgi:hypothetical protein
VTAVPEGLRPFVPLLPVLIPIWIAVLLLRFRRGGTPGRLAALYPAVAPAPGTRLRLERVVFGRGYGSMAWVRIGADRERLHVRIVTSMQGGGRFSVPHEEVTTSPDRYGWMILAPDVVRLRFARAPELVLLVWRRQLERLAEASGGRLSLAAAPTGAGPGVLPGGVAGR